MDDKLKQLLNQGRDLYEKRDFEKAEKILTKVLRKHHGFADVHNMLGVIYHDMGRFSQAKECFEQAIQINPRYTEAALNLAVTYNDLGLYKDAKEVYGKVIARSRSQPRPIDPFAKGKICNMHADLGEVYQGIGFYAEAVREYTQAVDLCPTFVDIRIKRANAYLEMGDLEASLREYRDICAKNPSYIPARLQLGVTLYAAKCIDEAIAEWRAILEVDPENKNAQMYLKMVGAPTP